MSRLPNLFILGAGRCGTTFLHEQLGRHPHVFMSPNKEPTFFCDSSGMTGPSEYLDQFSAATEEPYVGESSHAYMSSPTSAAILKTFVPNARFIVSLRNPVDRAYSLYAWMTAAGFEWRSPFEAALAAEDARAASERFKRNNPQYFFNYLYRGSGQYGEQVARYLEMFPRDRFHFLKFEDLLTDPLSELEGICSFLSIDPELLTADFQQVNQSRAVRSARFQYLCRCYLQPALTKLRFSYVSRLVDYTMARNLVGGKSDLMATGTRVDLAQSFQADLELLDGLTGLDTSVWRRDAELGTTSAVHSLHRYPEA